MASIAIGQYIPGNSLLHRLDPRIKIVISFLFMVAIFFCKNYISLAIVTVLAVVICGISKISSKIIFKGLRPILFIVLFTMVLNLFYGQGEALFNIGHLKITLDGINNAFFMALRIINLVLFGTMLTYTTTPTSLTDAIESLLKPLTYLKVDVHSFAMTMTIAIRFIPTLFEEVQKIIAAQKSRGADFDSGNIFKRVKAIVPIMIPLFVSAFRRANDLEYAMDCRCYHGGVGRTKMNKMHVDKKDIACLIFGILFFAGIILLKIFTKDII